MNITCFDTKSYDKTKEWLELHNKKKFNSSNGALKSTINNIEFLTLEILLKQHPSYSTWKHKNPASFHITRSKVNKAIQLFVSFYKNDKLAEGSSSEGNFSTKSVTKPRIVSWVICSKQKIILDEVTGEEIKRKGPKPKSVSDQLTSAMRHAIRKQIANFRRDNPHQYCELCNSVGSNGSKTTTTTNSSTLIQKYEVDHCPRKFVDIKSEFIDLMIKKSKPCPTEFLFNPKKGIAMFKKGTKADDYYDKKWKMAWQRYHLKHAQYRYLCSTHNKQTSGTKVPGIR